MNNQARKAIRFFTVLLLLGISPTIFSQDYPYLVRNDILEVIQQEVSGERAWDMVSKISRFHRIRGGGEGSDYDRCVEWLASELRQIGLRDVQVKRYEADGFKRYFLWDSLMGWKVEEAELWMVDPEKKLISRFSDQAVSLMPYSQGAEIEAEAVFVGEGKTDKDYENKDVRDKIVFAVGGGGAQVHREAVLKRGAAGVVVGPSRRPDRLEYPDLIEVNRLSPTGEEREKTGFGFSLSSRQVSELLGLFKGGQPIRMRAKVRASLFDGTMPVLEAKIIGQEYPGQEIVIMAHLDHYKPGANDNASGSAGMVEMARSILALMQRGDIPPPQRTIRFVWVPEMHGTIAYLSEHLDLAQRGIAGLNLDMIGEDYALCHSSFNLTCAPYSVPGYINEVVINLLQWLDSDAFFSPRGSRHLFQYRTRPYSGGSDHIMFNDSTFAIPTPMLGHGDVFHHTNLDTPDKCDPTEMKRIICLALASSLCLASADDQDALNIAREVYNRASVRLTERTSRSVAMIHRMAAGPDNRENLAGMYARASRYPFVQARIEKLNLRETKELCQNNETSQAIEEMVKALDHQARIEHDKVDFFYNLFLYLYKIDRKKFHPDEYFQRASVAIPERHFKGPLSSRIEEEQMSEAYKNWYRENLERVGGQAGSKEYEIVNLMDGKRNLLEIRDIVSCEFDETDIEFVFRFAQELNRIGLVSFKIGKS
jgi:hypothetical protein